MLKWLIVAFLVCLCVLFMWVRWKRVNEIEFEISHDVDMKMKHEQSLAKDEFIQQMGDLVLNMSWDNLLILGCMYQYGQYPLFKPNLFFAEQCFSLAAKSGDPQIAAQAQSKLLECRVQTMVDSDMEGDEIPPEFAQQAYAQMAHSVPRQNTALYTRTEPVQHPRDPFVDMDYQIDMQNAHDHAVTVMMKQKLANIPNSSVDRNIKLKIEESIDNADMPDAEKTKAKIVLQSLSDQTHATFGVSEIQALQNTVTQIENHGDPVVKENLLETLAKQLASGVEHGNVVCPTGKITRIVGTLDGTIDNNTSLKTMDTVKQELYHMASSVREGMMETWTDEQQHQYNLGDSSLEQQMKQKFIESAMSTYTELGFNEKILEPIVEQIADQL